MNKKSHGELNALIIDCENPLRATSSLIISSDDMLIKQIQAYALVVSFSSLSKLTIGSTPVKLSIFLKEDGDFLEKCF
jgi:hypothetical protein